MWDVLSWGGETQALIYNPDSGGVEGINALGGGPPVPPRFSGVALGVSLEALRGVIPAEALAVVGGADDELLHPERDRRQQQDQQHRRAEASPATAPPQVRRLDLARVVELPDRVGQPVVVSLGAPSPPVGRGRAPPATAAPSTPR